LVLVSPTGETKVLKTVVIEVSDSGVGELPPRVETLRGDLEAEVSPDT